MDGSSEFKIRFEHLATRPNMPHGFFSCSYSSALHNRTPAFLERLKVVNRFYICNIVQEEMSYRAMTAVSLILLVIFRESPDEWVGLSWHRIMIERKKELEKPTHMICVDSDFKEKNGDSALTEGLIELAQKGYLHYVECPGSSGINVVYIPSRFLIQKIIEEHYTSKRRQLVLP
jgi:hypothetical protein